MCPNEYYTTSDYGLIGYLLYRKVEIQRIDRKDPKRLQVTFYGEEAEKIAEEYFSGKEVRMSPLHYHLALRQVKSLLHSPPSPS